MVVSIASLWLPILVSAVLVFVTSSLIHMFLAYHRNDFRPLPDEDRAQNALAALNIEPGDYFLPFAGSAENMRSDAYQAKVKKGPVIIMTVMKPGIASNMGPQLVQWFAYSLLIGVVCAYVSGRVLSLGTDYLQVFRITGTVAFACYAMALMQRSIWYSQSWASTIRSMVDGLVYAALTGGAFGWLWPS